MEGILQSSNNYDLIFYLFNLVLVVVFSVLIKQGLLNKILSESSPGGEWEFPGSRASLSFLASPSVGHVWKSWAADVSSCFAMIVVESRVDAALYGRKSFCAKSGNLGFEMYLCLLLLSLFKSHCSPDFQLPHSL